MWFNLFLLCFVTTAINSIDINEIDLALEHMPYYLHQFSNIGKACKQDPKCLYADHVDRNASWGYERVERDPSRLYHVKPTCPGDHRGWVKTKKAQYETFYTQADFGYVKEQREESMVMCEATFQGDSSLECSKYLRFCRGRNLMLNFTGLVGRGDNLRYQTDILSMGQIGGYCKFHKKRLLKEAEHMSALQSWAPELVNFVTTSKRPIEEGLCDITIDKPTYIMKIDATVNMYHHFCDFFNLYASLHVNATHHTTFSKDNHILIWETFTYYSAFRDTFKAFTQNPIWDLKKFRGKVVCFKNIVFPLLPRMIFGLYYNTPLIYGCERSGLFHAFSTHILHRLNINLKHRYDDKIRITFLSRATAYRTIKNEKEILEELMKDDTYHVERIVYDKNVPFLEQLEITHNTDVFIGMHGAGLTHLLFLPTWAAVFEVYNCEDPNCYFDLARLKGIKYVTWEDKSKLREYDHRDGEERSHAKFLNYSFDVKEFVRLVAKCVEHVRSSIDYQTLMAGYRELEVDETIRRLKEEL